MFDIGYKNITNIDISEIVIEQMKRTFRDREMVWETVDATAMTNYADNSYSVIIDKGTLDAMMSEESENDGRKYFEELSRVLKPMGRILIISLLQEHILRALIKYFPSNNFHFRVVRCLEAEMKTMENNEDGTSMPVFMIVATKLFNLPQKIFEMSQNGESIEKLDDDQALISSILAIQRGAMFRNVLKKKSNADMEIYFDLFNGSEKNPRYSLFILDIELSSPAGDYAAFVVPQGRENEWLFSTKKGRRKLTESARHSRLAIVTMHRNQNYESLEEIQSEVNETIKSFAPKGLRDYSKIPFLSLGSIGKREMIFQGHSKFSGDFIIEDVTTDDNKIFRRLIFLNNQSVIQSEALMKKSKKKLYVDINNLSCSHHTYMLAGLNTVDQSKKLQNVVIGLGGGGLVNYICNFMRIRVLAVEIDNEIVKVAKDFFGLKNDEKNLEIVVGDGLEFLKTSTEQFQSILFDVDSKDSSQGMSCPPKDFISQEILTKVKSLLPNDGIFILNLVCRELESRSIAVESLKQVFPFIFSYKLDEDVNEIFYCFNDKIQREKVLESAKKFRKLNDDIDVDDFNEKLSLV